MWRHIVRQLLWVTLVMLILMMVTHGI